MPLHPDLSSGDIQPEDIQLYLPSACHGLVPVPDDLLAMEKRLRIAQANDSLVELRRLLRISSGLWQFKRTQVGPSQRAATRTRSVISRFTSKISHIANQYRAARQALICLEPNGEWSNSLQELKPEHVRSPGRHEDDRSEGHREVSWIWMAQSHSESEGDAAAIGSSK
jgi:hypothetical protein